MIDVFQSVISLGILDVELRIRIGFKTFTASNTGMDKGNAYPELGSVFKASFVKSASWWFAKKAVEIASAHPTVTWKSFRIFFFGGDHIHIILQMVNTVALANFVLKMELHTSSFHEGWDCSPHRFYAVASSSRYLSNGSC